MTALIRSLLGPYARQFIVQLTGQSQFLITGLLMSLGFRRRKCFGLRVAAGLLACFGLMCLSAVLRTDYEGNGMRIVVLLFQYTMMLPLMLLCFDEPLYLILQSWCVSISLAEIANALFLFALAVCGRNSRETISLFSDFQELRDWGIYFAFRLAVYFALYLLLRGKARGTGDRIAQRNLTILCLSGLTVLSITISLSNAYGAESERLYLIIRFYVLLICGMILLARAGITFQSQSRQDLALMEELLHEQRKQYDRSRESIHIINMRAHDLKHRLADLSDKLTESEVQDLQDAVRIYDGTIRTGNEVLDTVLYESQLTCESEGIRLSCLANGKSLDFMRKRDIYALFSNALHNAMEAVRKLEDPEKRNIGITVEMRDGQLEISVINYFQGEMEIRNGMPETTKSDRNHHGFGLQSMNYIVQQYGGTMTMKTEGSVFSLMIVLPVPESGKAGERAG